MKVAFFTERLLPGFGVDLVVYHLAMGLAERGHEATIWTILWDSQVYPEANNLRIRTVAIRRPRFYPLYELGAFLRFRYLAKSARDSDVWILTSLPFYGYAWLMKHTVRRNPHKHVPRVWVMEFGLPPAFGMPLAQRFNFAYMRWTQRRWFYPEADRTITISHFLQSDLPEDLQTEATVIYPGADHYPATPGDLRAELGIAPEEVLFLYIGRIDPASQPYKGVLNLVRMFQKAREKVQTPIRLALAGGGPPEICQQLSRQGVIVVQDLPPAKMGALILSADVIVSASAWEGFNLPIAEGQAFGKPVLCYAVGAHPEVVREEATGFLVRSEKEFVNCIRVLADHPAVRARMGREGHTWASRYRWRFAVDKLDALIRESGGAPV